MSVITIYFSAANWKNAKDANDATQRHQAEKKGRSEFIKKIYSKRPVFVAGSVHVRVPVRDGVHHNMELLVVLSTSTTSCASQGTIRRPSWAARRSQKSSRAMHWESIIHISAYLLYAKGVRQSSERRVTL